MGRPVREYRIRSKEGRIIWIQARGQIFCGKDGKVDHVSGVLFDITERQQAEENLRESEKNLRYFASQLLSAQEPQILQHRRGVGVAQGTDTRDHHAT